VEKKYININLIFKNKGDIQSCTNYKGIKLMSHIKNQFDFMPEKSTMKAIFLIRQLIERYSEQKNDLHMKSTETNMRGSNKS
jgi:hypothetical protein